LKFIIIAVLSFSTVSYFFVPAYSQGDMKQPFY